MCIYIYCGYFLLKGKGVRVENYYYDGYAKEEDKRQFLLDA